MDTFDDYRPRRERNGRWQKGHSGNPYGRPKKYKVRMEDENAFDFARHQIAINFNGQQKLVTREAALHYKLFELAMQGRPTAFRLMLGQIKEWRTRHARAVNRLEELEYHCLDPETGELPLELELELLELRRLVSRGATDAPFGCIDIAEGLRKRGIDRQRRREEKHRKLQAQAEAGRQEPPTGPDPEGESK
jgi:Family of unknown function (DUF5681)